MGEPVCELFPEGLGGCLGSEYDEFFLFSISLDLDSAFELACDNLPIPFER